MRFQRLALCLLACLIAVGCASTGPKPPKTIKVKHKKTYPRESRFWAAVSGDVQGFVLPMGLVTPKKNQLLTDATKGEFTFFLLAMHHKTSNEALTGEKLAPSIRVSIREAPVTNVDAMAVIAPLVKSRLNELSAERNRLSREVVTTGNAPAPAAPAPDGKAPEGAAPAAAQPPAAREQLTQIENEITVLTSIRAYLRTGSTDTKRGVVWFQIMAIPGKEDIAAIQSVQWTYGDGGMVDMQEYGYKYDMIDKLKLKQIAERPMPGFLPTFVKEWLEK